MGGFLNDRQIEELMDDLNDDLESENERTPNINQLCDARDSPEPVSCSEDSVFGISSDDSENEEENTSEMGTKIREMRAKKMRMMEHGLQIVIEVKIVTSGLKQFHVDPE
ncbi:unnamed protein product [Parnassius apollo]|uniref:(apollo) hypothetical protein n=1 Tax=Parnassius apollo TaxID=110799 RepID=A0A8S3WZA0_PARAO|nr:unnamed protein product [Parnassius apollo]